ncbi:hypothetical protein CDL15_Pgr028239 [Punica granatum]|uniref:U-box domain-containing protein n=1 Tax=Punica granatum TaxID=22663 RepID=A0A218WV36_PUNGR|nr:hypothetical protein CDL15_Pgr028239 [Punica granatum]
MQSGPITASVHKPQATSSRRSCPLAMREDLDQEVVIPHLFRCPISLDVFTDPVTLCTGQTYDRPNIERWLQLGNLTCPVTMQRLQDPSVVPNHTLRHLIEQWTLLGRQPVDPGRPLIALKHDLESHENTLTEKLHALQEVRLLSDESKSRCSYLIRMGFLSLLLELVFGQAQSLKSSQSQVFVEEALACVISLLEAADEPESSWSINMFKEESKLASFHELFRGGSSITKTSLCRLIEAICSSPQTQEISTLLVENGTNFSNELMVPLYQNDEVLLEAGLRAIRSLCSVQANRDALVQGGLLDGLVAHIQDVTVGSTHLMAMATLEQILGLEKAREALLDNPNGIKSLMKMVFRVSDLEGSESAVSCLTIVCENSLRAREAAIGFGVLTQLLLLLQSQCSGRTKTRARVLLKLLRSKEG